MIDVKILDLETGLLWSTVKKDFTSVTGSKVRTSSYGYLDLPFTLMNRGPNWQNIPVDSTPNQVACYRKIGFHRKGIIEKLNLDKFQLHNIIKMARVLTKRKIEGDWFMQCTTVTKFDDDYFTNLIGCKPFWMPTVDMFLVQNDIEAATLILAGFKLVRITDILDCCFPFTLPQIC